MSKHHAGGCHCGAVRFEADLDLAGGSGRCNCSYCRTSRSWGVIARPEAFRLLSDPGATTGYGFASHSNQHHFCPTGGIHVFSKGHLEAIGGDFVSIQIASLDGLTDAELAASPVTFQNGRDNDWRSEPAIVSYL